MTTDPRTPGAPDGFPTRRAVALWLLLTLFVLYFCVLDGLTAVGLVGPDEPRYAAIARDMAESGDWVTPRLHGQTWLEKPVLYYWTAAAAFRLGEDTEFSARLPSALAAILTTLALGWLAWGSYRWTAAAVVAVLFPTTVAAIGFGRAATTDMLFAASLAVAMVTATRIVCPSRARAAPPAAIGRGALLAAFGAALGLAALAKGPAALLLAGGSVAMWVVLTRRWRAAFALAHPLAIAAFAAVALPWYVLCAMRNPEFVQVFLIAHNFQRFLTPVFRHEQPVWFFGPVLLVALMPWTLLLAEPVRRGIGSARNGNWRQSTSLFIGCWAVFPVLFFSISQSKLPGYVLPAIPALAFLMACGLGRAMQEKRGTARWLLLGAAAMLVLLGGAAMLPQAIAQLPGLDASLAQGMALVAGGGGAVAGLLAARGRFWMALATVAMVVALLVAGLNRLVLPRIDSALSPRAAASLLPQAASEVSVFRVHRAWHYGLNYYFRRELPEWTRAQTRGWLYTSEEGYRELRQAGSGSFRVEGRAGRVLLLALDHTE